MKKGWEVKKLGEVCENLDSKRIPITQNKRVAGEIPYYGASGIVDYVEGNIFNENLLLVSEDGANLLARTYPIAFSITGKTWVNNHAHVLRFTKMTTQLYVEFYLNSIKLEPFVSGMAQPKLNQQMLNSIPIPFAPIEEQERIVAILDEAFAAIDKAKENLERNMQNAKELFESELNSIFEKKGDGWVEKKLGEVFKFRQGIQRDVKLQSEKRANNQVRFLRIVDYTQGNELPRYIDNPGEEYIMNEDDIAVVRYGASTGFICKGLAGALANNLFRIMPKEQYQIDSTLTYYYLNSIVFQSVIKLVMNGAAMPAISFGLINDIPFNIIPIKEQQKIVEQLDRLSVETKKLEEGYRKKLEGLEELKKSMLERAFKGEL